MELAILRAEVSRLADKYFWLRHAFVVVESGPADWHDMDNRFIVQLPWALDTDNRFTTRRMIDWRPWCMGASRGFSVWIADGGTDAEAKAAILQYEALAEHVAEHMLFRMRWEGKADLVVVGEDGTNAPERLLDHVHAVYAPHRRCSDGRRDVDGLALGIYELHCGVFQAVAACLPEEQQERSIPSSNRTRPMTLGEAGKYLGRRGSSKDAAKWVRQCIDDGEYTVEQKTRQSYIFDKSQFPEAVWGKILPR